MAEAMLDWLVGSWAPPPDLRTRMLNARCGSPTGGRQKGYRCWSLWALIQMTSVKSFRLSGPVRPQPLSRTPPIGAWISSLTVGEFTLTMPARTFGAISNALYVSPARIDDVNPYIVLLAALIASSAVSTTSTTTTGPNVSSFATAVSSGTSVRIVG